MLNAILKDTAPHSERFVTLTYAQSLDGSISKSRGVPTAISGKLSLEMTHGLRASHEGILVGVDTIIADNPSLTVRYCSGKFNHPVAIIVDSNLRIPVDCKVIRNLRQDQRRVVVVYSNVNASGSLIEELKEKGVEIVLCKEDGHGRVDLADMFGN